MNSLEKIFLTIVIALPIIIAFQNVSATANLCGGKHNIQIQGNTLPNVGISGFSTNVFVLPEISGFQELYKDFSVTGAKAILFCQSGQLCDLFVNNQPCLTGVPGNSQSLHILNCTNLFKDGINTMDFRSTSTSSTGFINWVFLETRITSLFC